MGKIAKKISERQQHANITKGYGFCVICGNKGKLSIDHVPPKGAITITKIEQRHISEAMGAKFNQVKGVFSNTGSTFKTICATCNNLHLGENDAEIKKVNLQLKTKIQKHFLEPFTPSNTISVDIDAIKYSRAMIGHILAATSTIECKEEQVDSPYFTPLKDFVLGDDSAIENTHDIYYWFYPHEKHLSAKLLGFYNSGHMCCMSLLSFFPIAFLVTEKNKGVAPAQASKLELHHRKLHLNLSSQNIKYADFPFVELKGEQMILHTDYLCIATYPVKNK